MTDAGYQLHQGDARHLDMIDDESVDLVVTSPPYFGQRSYTDDGEAIAGQIGGEPHPREFLEALWEVAAECWRVLKPSGSMFVNLGDKRSGSGAPGSTSGLGGRPQGKRTEISVQEGYTKAAFGRAKSKQMLPQRFAIGCEDGLADPVGDGWVTRQELVWAKPNGLPESVKDRCRDSHELWYHLTRDGSYYSAMDEIREEYADGTEARYANGFAYRTTGTEDAQLTKGYTSSDGGPSATNPLGKLPGSVWLIPTEPLTVPIAFCSSDEISWTGWGQPCTWSSTSAARFRRQLWSHATDALRAGRSLHVSMVDHYAAFPSEWPRRLILGWSPPAICLECGEGRRIVMGEGELDLTRPQARRAADLAYQGGLTPEHISALSAVGLSDTGRSAATQNGRTTPAMIALADEARTVLGGYAREFLLRRPCAPVGHTCACVTTDAPTRPAVVLDPFAGTGTTVMVARALGRYGVGVDLSADYLRLAEWRVQHDPRAAKVRDRTHADRQGVLL